MEHSYPITCEQLRMMPAIIQAQQKQAFINKMVEHVSLEIINTAYCSKTNCEFTWQLLMSNGQKGSPEVYMAVRDGSFEPYINAVIDDLKLRFPDCRFSQDPAKKYLFVDWY
jgi:hypothetical protein